jgi:two-component system chemotaxis response regulator CheB
MDSGRTSWVVAIGASGIQGLGDIEALVAALPAGLNAIVIIVLHRSWEYPSRLKAILARASALPVVIAAEDERLRAGFVCIGEPAEHLTLVANSFGSLVQDPGRQHRNRTINLLFTSVALRAGRRMIGVILWMTDHVAWRPSTRRGGHDGADACRLIGRARHGHERHHL